MPDYRVPLLVFPYKMLDLSLNTLKFLAILYVWRYVCNKVVIIFGDIDWTEAFFMKNKPKYIFLQQTPYLMRRTYMLHGQLTRWLLTRFKFALYR